MHDLDIADDGVSDQLDGGDEEGAAQHQAHGHLNWCNTCSPFIVRAEVKNKQNKFLFRGIF